MYTLAFDVSGLYTNQNLATALVGIILNEGKNWLHTYCEAARSRSQGALFKTGAFKLDEIAYKKFKYQNQR